MSYYNDILAEKKQLQRNSEEKFKDIAVWLQAHPGETLQYYKTTHYFDDRPDEEYIYPLMQNHINRGIIK